MSYSRTTHDDRERMVAEQLAARGINNAAVLSAMRRVPRERFMSKDQQPLAYQDNAAPIACGQTISQPYIVGLMTQALELTGNERVLEIGTGSGYQAAVVAELARDVVSVERHAELAEDAAATLTELGYENVDVVCADGTLGWPARAPYDRIIVTAASPTCPDALLDQLVDGGVTVIPIGEYDSQTLQRITKRGDRTQRVHLCPCRFVPLLGQQGWNPGDSTIS
ncbi:MAG: protein-L-isoaspartate(D-aspartate) O-methyltransferase [Pirellulales bacterium]|nr:protein-L-isoaspartate(D-aspartate) O-methyltransferase [Pirellulales bacterium]